MNQQQRIRALILQEFQAGRTVRQACLNIYRELGKNAPSDTTVRKWFKKFEAGDTNLRNKNDPAYNQPLTIGNDVYLKANKAVLFESGDKRLLGLKTIDGRLGYGYHENSVLVVDFFHGRLATFSTDEVAPVPLEYNNATVVNGSRIILLEVGKYRRRRRLFRVRVIDLDFDTLTFHRVAQADYYVGLLAFPYNLILDQSNANVFGASNDPGYILGELKDDGVSMRDYQLNNNTLYCTKLDGNKLCGLRDSETPGNCRLIEYNLQTTVTQTTEIPNILENGEPFNQHLRGLPYTWSGTTLYTHQNGGGGSTYRLDTTTRVWSKLNFSLGDSVAMLSIADDVLTVKAAEDRRGKSRLTIHRFPLRYLISALSSRPDSLVNLAWFSVRYHHNFRGSGTFERLSKRLPYNTYLRCPFPDDA